MTSNSLRHRLPRMAGFLAASLAVLLASSVAAQAHDGKNHHSYPRRHQNHGAPVRVAPARPAPVIVHQRPSYHSSHFVVPQRIIALHDMDYYRPYLVRRYYHAPRHCWRSIYSFPVYNSFGVEYRPYLYEEGRLVIGAQFGGPGFNFGFTWVGGH